MVTFDKDHPASSLLVPGKGNDNDGLLIVTKDSYGLSFQIAFPNGANERIYVQDLRVAHLVSYLQEVTDGEEGT